MFVDPYFELDRLEDAHDAREAAVDEEYGRLMTTRSGMADLIDFAVTTLGDAPVLDCAKRCGIRLDAQGAIRLSDALKANPKDKRTRSFWQLMDERADVLAKRAGGRAFMGWHRQHAA